MSRLWTTIRRKGVRGTAKAIADRLEERLLETYFERRLGIATSGTVSRESLNHPDDQYSYYAPSTYGNIRRILRALDVRPGRDVLLDLGAGKGRVLVMAAREPFVRIAGVERSPELSAMARRHVDHARGRRRCRHVDVVTADASTYDLPDDVTIIYFASPFGGGILDAVLDHIRASLVRAPRPVRLVSHGYDATNSFESRIRRCDWLTVRAEVPLQRSNCAWIYGNSRWTTPHDTPAS
jgi:SAM-dependent methyltransferase